MIKLVFMDARKTIEKLKGEADRQRTSLYLSRALMDGFRAACGTIAPSRVLEELMREFIESAKKSKPKKVIKKS
jgi:hypothetical protein